MKRLALLLYFPLAVMAAPKEPPALARSLDVIIASKFPSGLPGVAAVLITHQSSP